MTHHFRLGLLINPLAGVGGQAGLKGSDGVAAAALAMGVRPRAQERVRQAFEAILPLADKIDLYTAPGSMGADLLTEIGLKHQTIGYLAGDSTTADYTRRLAAELSATGLDLLLFAGGDGTARDICAVVGDRQLVLGIPAGVKIHSGVYAVNPRAAGELVGLLVEGELVRLAEAEVRDIDEDAFRAGAVRTRHFGELRVPEEGRFVQQVKQGGREQETLVLDDIAAWLQEQQDDGVGWILGPGSSNYEVLKALRHEGTLLGVDVLRGGELILRDATEGELWELVSRGGDWRILVSAIGGQGHILGRGNQQISPRIVRAVGLDNLLVIATKTKLKTLAGRPFLLDSGEPELDQELTGLRRVLSGYREEMLYPASWKAE